MSADPDLQGLVQWHRRTADIERDVFIAQFHRQAADAIERLSKELASEHVEVIAAIARKEQAQREAADWRAATADSRGTCSLCRFLRIEPENRCTSGLTPVDRLGGVIDKWGCMSYKPQPTATEKAEK